MAYVLPDVERAEMMNALGLTRIKKSYRNHYVVLRGGAAHARWNALEAKGLVISAGEGERLVRFHVTNKGIKALGVDDRVNAENRVPDPPSA